MTNNQSGGGSGDEQKKKNVGINDMILSSMKSRSGRETTKWINNLTREGMKEIEESAKTPSSNPQGGLPAQFAHPSIAQTQVKWVDRLFDIFQQYEVEFNRACQIPDLRVTAERPVLTPDLIARLQSNDQYHYTGRLHTRYWTLAIRGNLSHIEAYMIPSDHFIGFENNTQNYNRFFEFVPMFDGELRWSFERGSISSAQLPSMAKLIFGHLIKVAKGDVDSIEPFSYGLGPTTPRPAKPASWSASSNPSDYLAQHSGVFEDDKPGQTEAPSVSRNAAVTSTPEPLETVSPSSALASSAATESARDRRLGTTSGQFQSLSAPSAPALAKSTDGVATDDLSMVAACDLLGRSILRELESLSKAGAKAFEDHDFVEVERLMKRTAKLKLMQEKMLATINEWKRMLSED